MWLLQQRGWQGQLVECQRLHIVYVFFSKKQSCSQVREAKYYFSLAFDKHTINHFNNCITKYRTILANKFAYKIWPKNTQVLQNANSYSIIYLRELLTAKFSPTGKSHFLLVNKYTSAKYSRRHMHSSIFLACPWRTEQTCPPKSLDQPKRSNTMTTVLIICWDILSVGLAQ